MRKNNLIHLTVSAAIVLAASFSLSSCEDILGEWDRSTPELFPPNAVTITKTETGATVTVNAPSDITNLLASVTSDIAAKGSSEYVFDVTNGGVKSTGSDNTITVPKVSGSNINLVFEKGINTESPLIIKASETASATPTTAVNKLTITMPAGTTSLNLVIDMPETSVTVKTSAGSVIYEGIVANTAINTLVIENGVTVKSLQVKGGIVVVKDGGKVETNVYAPESNDYVMYQYGDKEGVEPVWVDLKGDGNYVPNVQNEDGSPYLFKNLKVIKGTADYARIALYNGGKPLEKLTIAADAAVLFNQQSPCVKVIEGEGDATAKIMFNYFWGPYDVDNYFENNGYLNAVESLKNVVVDVFSDDDHSIVKYSYLYEVPANSENVIFKMGSVGFKDPESTNATVKNCKFEGVSDYKGVRISAPYQTEEISNFKFTFDGCEFIEGCRFSCNINDGKPKVDEKGNYVYKTFYCWWVFNAEGTGSDGWYHQSESLDDVPESAKTVGQCSSGWDTTEGKSQNGLSTGYWVESQQQYEKVTYNNYYAYIVFNSCKYAGATLTPEALLVEGSWIPEGANLRYEIDGTLYKAERDEENGKYVLIPA